MQNQNTFQFKLNDINIRFIISRHTKKCIVNQWNIWSVCLIKKDINIWFKILVVTGLFDKMKLFFILKYVIYWNNNKVNNDFTTPLKIHK